jgi:hypothetical protein
MATYVIYDMSTGDPLGIYTADSPRSDGIQSEGRTLRHARLPEGVDPNFSHPEEIEGEWVAVQDADAPPPPAPVVPDMHAIVTARIEESMRFGQTLIRDFAVENVLMGITQMGMTNVVRKTMLEVGAALTTGSLYDAIAEAKAIPAEKKNNIFVNDTRLLTFVNRIEDFLGIPRSTSL